MRRHSRLNNEVVTTKLLIIVNTSLTESVDERYYTGPKTVTKKYLSILLQLHMLKKQQNSSLVSH
jgi:hypothetical protein